MKKSPLNRIGRIGKANLEANKRLRELFEEKGIRSCEIKCEEGCLGAFTSAFAHRHKRYWYKGDVKKLSDFRQVVIACTNCHNKIENSRELTERYFTLLRGEEL